MTQPQKPVARPKYVKPTVTDRGTFESLTKNAEQGTDAEGFKSSLVWGDELTPPENR